MKKINIILAILLFTALNSTSQSVSAPTATSNNVESVIEDSKKYHVALCDYKSDTLTYEQLKGCNEINITNDPQIIITYYNLVCRFGESDIYEFAGRGNTLPKQVIETLLSKRVTQFWLEEIIAKKGDIKLEIGTQKFFLKD